jgi:hypothetical protein
MMLARKICSTGTCTCIFVLQVPLLNCHAIVQQQVSQGPQLRHPGHVQHSPRNCIVVHFSENQTSLLGAGHFQSICRP